jgi:hypothetical protein
MRPLGHVLLWLGFLAAAFVSTRQADVIAWGGYAAAAVVGVAGVVLLRRTAAAVVSHRETIRANIATLESSLARLVKNVSALNAARESTFVYDVHGRIDDELAPDLAAFAEAREAMIHGIGLQEYADVMDHFARGERALNRAWSASADGYVDEVWTYTALGEEALRLAETTLRGHLGRHAPEPHPA